MLTYKNRSGLVKGLWTWKMSQPESHVPKCWVRLTRRPSGSTCSFEKKIKISFFSFDSNLICFTLANFQNHSIFNSYFLNLFISLFRNLSLSLSAMSFGLPSPIMTHIGLFSLIILLSNHWNVDLQSPYTKTTTYWTQFHLIRPVCKV